MKVLIVCSKSYCTRGHWREAEEEEMSGQTPGQKGGQGRAGNTKVNLNCGQGRGENIGENSRASCSTPKPKESNLRRRSVSKLSDKI